MSNGAQSPSPLIPANSVLVFDLELIAIKDPRLSVVGALWRSVRLSRTLVVLRDPVEVVASLARRGVGFERSVRLWMRYTLQAYSDAGDAVSVVYSDLFDDVDRVVESMQAGFGLDVSGHMGVVATGLRHNRGADISLDSCVVMSRFGGEQAAF